MAAVKPREANPTVSVLSSLSANAARSVERVHLGNVHALALAASHLAAADVLAVVVLQGILVREYQRYARVSVDRAGAL